MHNALFRLGPNNILLEELYGTKRGALPSWLNWRLIGPSCCRISLCYISGDGLVYRPRPPYAKAQNFASIRIQNVDYKWWLSSNSFDSDNLDRRTTNVAEDDATSCTSVTKMFWCIFATVPFIFLIVWALYWVVNSVSNASDWLSRYANFKVDRNSNIRVVSVSDGNKTKMLRPRPRSRPKL